MRLLNKPAALLLFLFSLAILQACTFGDPESEKVELNALMDSWHHAAASADEDAFFGFMTEDCIYLGTDETEKWKRDELRMWSEKYFDRESAWSFEPLEREIYFSADGKTAWFDEKLKTWMGICRGSGVLVHAGEEWKLRHYNLAVTVPNEKIKGFIELVGKD